MESIVSLIHSITTIIFFSFKDITEEEIERNLQFLNQETWFQEYLNHISYKQSITDNTDVRKVIGSMNISKMSKPGYKKRQQKRLKRALQNY